MHTSEKWWYGFEGGTIGYAACRVFNAITASDPLSGWRRDREFARQDDDVLGRDR